jgi:hypothetical protein
MNILQAVIPLREDEATTTFIKNSKPSYLLAALVELKRMEDRSKFG